MKTSNEQFSIATSDLTTVIGGQRDHDPTSSTWGASVAGAAGGTLIRLLATPSVPPLPPATDALRAWRAHVPV